MSGFTPQPGRATDTIFALASGPGKGAIAVIRVSGPQTRAILAALCGVPAPRRASLRSLRDTAGRLLDQALVLWLPGPASYTGEDSAELHVHGGRAVIRAVTHALLQADARPADAGEFTRRAFLAGRMTLLEAEAIADLSASETESQREQALRLAQGGADEAVQDWSVRATRLLAFEEALIDFPDEGLPASVLQQNADDAAALAAEIAAALAGAQAGARVREGLVFVIAGPPNAGKSSLFNTLAGRDAAIVSPHPGTTRDSLEVPLELGGILVTLVDTAGLREAADDIEAEGIARTHARIANADLVIELSEAAGLCALGRADTRPDRLLVASKCDLGPAPAGLPGISTLTGQGVAALLAQLTERAQALVSAHTDPLLSRARHVAALRDALAALQAAAVAPWPELRAEEFRLARASLARLTGQADTNAVLDVVFSTFCIGK